MLTKRSDQHTRLRLVPVFGDLAMIAGLLRSRIWQQFYMGSKRPWWSIFVWVFHAKVEMFAFASRAVLRYDHGRHTAGLVMSLWTSCLIAAFNSDHGLGFLTSFVPFAAPVIPFVVPVADLADHVFAAGRSDILAVYLIAFSVAAMIHVGRIYARAGKTNDHRKRGVSWLARLLPKHRLLREPTIQTFIEPALVLAAGYAALIFAGDVTVFWFAVISAVSLFFQEFIDGAYRYYHGLA